MNEKKLIEVCDACWQASCWHGEFFCQEAETAGTVRLPIGVLRELGLEHEDNWSDTKLTEIYGVSDPWQIGAQ